MKNLLIGTLVAAVCLNVVLGVMFFSARQQNDRLKARLEENLRSTTNALAAADSKDRTIELLESKVNQLIPVLTNKTAQLQAANETIQAYELAETARSKQQEGAQRLSSQVPEPKVTVLRDAAGKETKTFIFPSVMDKAGNVVARNAEFVKPYGRRLLFRTEAGPITMDVEAVDSAVLHYLSIDAGEAIQKHQRNEAAWKARQAAEYQTALAEQARQALLRIEQEKANAEIAKVQSEQRVVQEAAYNERIKAEAAARTADAAIIQALNPQPSTVIQNVNQNLNQNRAGTYWR